MSTAQLLTKNFAIGYAFVNPNAGLLPTNASPSQLNTIQEASVEFTGKIEELRGQLLYAVDARLTDVTCKGKFSTGQWTLEQLNNVFYAGTLSTSDVDNIVPDEASTVPSSSPYTITVTEGSGFVEDLGVQYADNAQSFDRVTPTAAGEYSVGSGGTYTFGVADAGADVLISYIATGTGSSIQATNNLQGQSPQFEFAVWNPIGGGVTGYNGIRVLACVANGIKPLTAKRNGFAMWEVDWTAFCPTGSYVAELIRA
jgi:hypothetical protein